MVPVVPECGSISIEKLNGFISHKEASGADGFQPLRVFVKFIFACAPASAFNPSGPSMLAALDYPIFAGTKNRYPSRQTVLLGLPSTVDSESQDLEALPPMSSDGGSEDEFNVFWQNAGPVLQLPGGWVQFWSHPQVNVLPYWYHQETRETVWQAPRVVSEKSSCINTVKNISIGYADRSSSVWNMTVEEIRAMLSSHGEVENQGLVWEDVARRACYEYEQSQFVPRVQSFHDFENVTSWFFGGMKGRRKGRALFAEDAFFHALAGVATERMYFIHPISLVYMLWAFTRARVKAPELMHAAADYLSDGRLPMLDRCGLGMGLRVFAEQGVMNQRLFECAAVEIRRPVRLRSLAARNIQNLIFAHKKLNVYHEGIINDFARMTVRLLDGHDPQQAKTRVSVVFPYTCKDGHVEPADMFRINKAPSLTWVLQCYLDLHAPIPILEKLIAAMVNFANLSIAQAPLPKSQLQPQDLVPFVHELSRAAERGCAAAVDGLEILAVPIQSFCQGLASCEFTLLTEAYDRAGVTWPSENSDG